MEKRTKPKMRLARAINEAVRLRFNVQTGKLGDLVERFHEIAAKHGLRKYTPEYNEDGTVNRLCADNYEWTVLRRTVLGALTGDFRLRLMVEDLKRRKAEAPAEDVCAAIRGIDAIEMADDTPLAVIRDAFCQAVASNGVIQGGINVCNPNWQACCSLLLDNIENYYDYQSIFGPVPDALRY